MTARISGQDGLTDVANKPNFYASAEQRLQDIEVIAREILHLIDEDFVVKAFKAMDQGPTALTDQFVG
ncbi:hypothetical protein D3C78_1848600 [compost metagenome]